MTATKAPKGMNVNHRTWTQHRRPEIGEVIQVKKPPRTYLMVSADGKTTVHFREQPFSSSIIVTTKCGLEWSRVTMALEEANRHYRTIKAQGFVKW